MLRIEGGSLGSYKKDGKKHTTRASCPRRVRLDSSDSHVVVRALGHLPKVMLPVYYKNSIVHIIKEVETKTTKTNLNLKLIYLISLTK